MMATKEAIIPILYNQLDHPNSYVSISKMEERSTTVTVWLKKVVA